MKNMNEINGNMNGEVEGGNAIEEKVRVDDFITINGERPPIALGRLNCQDVIVSGEYFSKEEKEDVVDSDETIEVYIDLKQCPHNTIETLEEGFMLLCNECSEHYTENALRFNGINNRVRVWINDDGHAHTAHEYLSYCMNQSSEYCECCNDWHFTGDTIHLEAVMQYIQSHLHHPNNEWGNHGPNYQWG